MIERSVRDHPWSASKSPARPRTASSSFSQAKKLTGFRPYRPLHLFLNFYSTMFFTLPVMFHIPSNGVFVFSSLSLFLWRWHGCVAKRSVKDDEAISMRCPYSDVKKEGLYMCGLYIQTALGKFDFSSMQMWLISLCLISVITVIIYPACSKSA